MARCLVLGANGFIGSHLVDALIDKGHFVRCFGRYKSGSVNFASSEPPSVEIFRGDFLNRNDIKKALDGIDYVFHFISTTNPFTAENDPLVDIETNIKMSVELFRLCSENSVKKIIFASTGGSIYGDVGTDKAISEKTYPRPVSPYAIGKLTIENYLRYFKRKYDLDYLILRISNPYGPRQNTLSGQGVISIFLEKIRQNQPLKIYGDGSMVRDYIYVADAARMISECFDKKSSSNIYNLSSGIGYSVNDLVKTIENVAQINAVIEHIPAPPTFVHKVILDPSLFKNDFGGGATISLEEGVLKTWQELKAQT